MQFISGHFCSLRFHFSIARTIDYITQDTGDTGAGWQTDKSGKTPKEIWLIKLSDYELFIISIF